MPTDTKKLLLCNCEKSMVVDGKLIGKTLTGEELPVHSHLCRSEIGQFEKVVGGDQAVCVGCTQESALFSEVAEELGKPEPTYFNIRELAGWSETGGKSAPKMAALAALAARERKPSRVKTLESDGLCLVIGSGQQAFYIATLLNRTLSVTLLLQEASDVILPTVLDFPVFSGKVSTASGSFGRFEVVVDGYASLLPSSRGNADFAMPRDGAKSSCSVIFDMTGNTALFSHHEKRDGYFMADPGDPAAVMRQAFEASGAVGEFEKPIYVSYNAEICAHSRSGKVGCKNCIDSCPAGAISPDGDGVRVDTDICGGCGNCAAHCPTGAVRYEYTGLADQISEVQLLAKTYVQAGGKNPFLLLHDATHGLEMINALARFGKGLPDNVIPYEMHSTSGVGHALLSAALGAGFSRVVILANPRRDAEYEAARNEIELFDSFCEGLGLTNGRVTLISESDPDTVGEALSSLKTMKAVAAKPFVALGNSREIARAALSALAAASKSAPEVIALPASAPYGRLNVDTEGCTLCLACVSSCPADALRDNPDKPQVRFVENACVQCGICASTCPEGVISLEPRYNFTPSAMQPITLYEEEPFECTRCGKPFAAKSTIERISAQLAGVHRMFASERNSALLTMCDNCRLEVLAENGNDPFAIANPNKPRTTDDYLEAKKSGLSVDDFLSDD